MKKLLKVSSYILATVLAFVLSNVSAFAAGNTENSSLTGAQVIGGLAILLLVILVPTMKSARKASINR
jgi:hypothetical protein